MGTNKRNRLSHLAGRIVPSSTLAMNKRANEMKEQGRTVIPMSLGEPDFHTPESVKLAGISAIERNFTKYTSADGMVELKGAISEKLLADNGIAAKPAQIVVGSGAKIIILAVLQSILDPGDEVIVPAPYWTSYPELVALAGGGPVLVDCAQSDGFKLNAESLRRNLSARTRALIFNSPSNPSGAIYSEDEIRALAAVLEERPDIWVVTDELYEHLCYGDRRAPSFAAVAVGMADRIVTINGFSKGYCMTGWRLGFAAGPADVMAAVSTMLGQMQGSPSSISQAAALAALQGPQDFLRENRETLRQRRDFLVAAVNAIPGLSATLPEGAFYIYVNCEELIGRRSGSGRLLASDLDVVEALLSEAAISSVHGAAFGKSPYIRLSFALELGQIKEATVRMDVFVRALV